MIADNHCGTFARDVVEAGRSQAVDDIDHDPGQEAHQEFRQQRVDVDRHQRIQDRDDDEQLGNGEPRPEHDDGENRCADHEQRIDDVVGRDDSGQVPALGPLLNQRVQRNAVKAAESAEQCKVCQYPPTAAALQEFDDGRSGHRVRVRLSEIQVDGEQAEADRAEWHKTEFDAMSRHALAE